MAITDVRSKIKGILSEGAKKKPKDPHKKDRMGAPEATGTDGADACCESEMFEEVTSAPDLSPMANMVLGTLRQRLEQGNFQSLTQEVIEQIKASHPDKEGEIEQAFEELKAKGLISVSDGGISVGQPAQDEHVLRDCTVEHVAAEADRILREFSFLRRGNNSLEGQDVYHLETGRRGNVIADNGDGEVAIRYGLDDVAWHPRDEVDVDMETKTYLAPIGAMQELIKRLTGKGSKFSDPEHGWQWKIEEFGAGGQTGVYQCQVKAARSFHRELSNLFLTKDQVMAMNESVELTTAGLQLAVENLTFVPK